MTICLVCRGRVLSVKFAGDPDRPAECVSCGSTRVVRSDDEQALEDVLAALP